MKNELKSNSSTAIQTFEQQIEQHLNAFDFCVNNALESKNPEDRKLDTILLKISNLSALHDLFKTDDINRTIQRFIADSFNHNDSEVLTTLFSDVDKERIIECSHCIETGSGGFSFTQHCPLTFILHVINENTNLIPISQKLIIILMEKGMPLTVKVLSKLMEIKNDLHRQVILDVMMSHFDKALLNTNAGSLSSCAKYAYQLMEHLIKLKYSTIEFDKILDIIDGKDWQETFYNVKTNSLIETAFTWLEKDRDYTIALFGILVSKRRLHNTATLYKLFEKLLDQLNTDNANNLLELFLKFNHVLPYQDDRLIALLIKKKDHLEDSTLKDKISAMLSTFIQLETKIIPSSLCYPFFKDNKYSSDPIFTPLSHEKFEDTILLESHSNFFELREQTKNYFNQLHQVTQEYFVLKLPQVLINLISAYMDPPHILDSIRQLEHLSDFKKNGFKLQLFVQEPNTSDCGAYAFISALFMSALITENYSLWKYIVQDRVPQFEDEKKGEPKKLVELVKDSVLKEAKFLKQNEEDVSPIIMKKLIQNPGFQKQIKIIKNFNQAPLTIVPISIESKSNEASIGVFEVTQQLQMLNVMMTLSNRFHKGEPIAYPFLIFLREHWITALYFGKQFLICDSINADAKDLIKICQPIEEAITSGTALQDLCKTILSQAYTELDFFKKAEIRSTGLILEQAELLLQTWLGIMNNTNLTPLLSTAIDGRSFKIVQELINFFKDQSTSYSLEKHIALVYELERFSLFSRAPAKAINFKLEEIEVKATPTYR